MYHIKNDKRSYTSANALYEALQVLLVANDYDLKSISISHLVQKAMVGRSTFYRNFDEMIDILKWKADVNFQEVLNNYVQQKTNSVTDQTDFIQYVFTYWEDHYQILDLLLKINRTDIIYNAFMKAAPTIMDYMQKQNVLTEIPQKEIPYFLNIRISILLGVMNAWIANGRQESPSEVAQILAKDRATLLKMKLLF